MKLFFLLSSAFVLTATEWCLLVLQTTARDLNAISHEWGREPTRILKRRRKFHRSVGSWYIGSVKREIEIMAIQTGINSLAAKFRGCMIGGLIGDCIGAPFEAEISDDPGHHFLLGELAGSTSSKSWKKTLKNFFTTLLYDSPAAGASKIFKYTDDTAMTLSVARSLVEKRAFDPKDMAERFVHEYFLQPHKGYGSGVVDVFYALRQNGCEDVFEPAKHQFGGSGSYGNGAAMRVAPVALFGYKQEDVVKQVAENSSLITHTHQHGYNGAILQALAVHQALIANDSGDFNPVQFVETLLEKMEKIEKEISGAEPLEKRKPYCESLKRMKQIFEKLPLDITAEEVAAIFGNHVTAQKSVPAAIFSFLRGFQPLENFESSNPFVRTLYFAIEIGGDTDTIACMAGSIAGAYHGESVIPDCLMRCCEAVEELRSLADQLFQMKQI